MRRIAIPLFCALLGGCAASPAEMQRIAESEARQDQRLAEALEGYEVSGRPVNCVQQTTLRGNRSFGNTILYEVGGGGTLYRNDTQPGCRIRQDDILVTRSPIGNFCSGDIITTIDRTSRFTTGSCAFGDFIPYRRVRDRDGS